jgi:hypothetical protein
MKAKELIEELQKLDPETLVLVDGYEGGYASIRVAKQIEVHGPLKREWYYGEYDVCPKDELLKLNAFLLER